MLLLPLHRHQLLDHLPQGRIAEVGVQRGFFSRQLFQYARPTELHLIDPWEDLQEPGYDKDFACVDNATHEQFFQMVHAWGQPLDNVYLHRTTLDRLLEPLKGLDWLYLDANHTAEAVRRDLHLAQLVVKSNGLLLCHDYTDHMGAQRMGFGVKAGVRAFCAETDWLPIAMTNEAYPTVVLCRDKTTQAQLIDRLLRHVRHCLQLEDPWHSIDHLLLCHKATLLDQVGEEMTVPSYPPRYWHNHAFPEDEKMNLLSIPRDDGGPDHPEDLSDA